MNPILELVEGSAFNRGHFADIRKFQIIPRHTECYTSMFVYPESATSYFNANKSDKTGRPSVVDYPDEVGIRALYIDIDMEGISIERVANECRKILDIIEIKYDLTEDNLQVFFSGNKGFHIVIPISVFADKIIYSNLASSICRLMIADILDIDYKDEEAAKKMSESVVDFKTIHNTAIFRVPLSKNAKTGMYKIPVTRAELISNPQNILERAKVCEHSGFDTKKRFVKNEKMAELFKRCAFEIIADELDITTVKHLNRGNTVFYIPKKGERDAVLHKIGYRLYGAVFGMLKNDEINDILRAFWEAANIVSIQEGHEAMDEKQLLKIINNSRDRAIKARTNERVKIDDISSIAGSIFDDFQKAVRIPTYIHEYDRHKGGLLKGSLYYSIGKYKTYKSIFWIVMAIKNALAGVCGIYYSMEMSKAQFFSIAAKFLYQIDIEEGIKKGSLTQEKFVKLISDIESRIGDNLKIVFQSDINEQQISATIADVKQLYKKDPQFIIIDSTGSLKYVGDEIKSLIYYSKYLKELAKRDNVAVVALNHVTQACSFEERFPENFVRGGSKILDNADGFFCHSLVADEIETTIATPVYRERIIYWRGVMKRENVKFDDKILSVDPDNLEILDSGEDPNSIFSTNKI